jgi:hypothetical protein
LRIARFALNRQGFSAPAGGIRAAAVRKGRGGIGAADTKTAEVLTPERTEGDAADQR